MKQFIQLPEGQRIAVDKIVAFGDFDPDKKDANKRGYKSFIETTGSCDPIWNTTATPDQIEQAITTLQDNPRLYIYQIAGEK